MWPHLYFLAARRWQAHNVKDGVSVFFRRRCQEPWCGTCGVVGFMERLIEMHPRRFAF
jgi:hypothetical protein